MWCDDTSTQQESQQDTSVHERKYHRRFTLPAPTQLPAGNHLIVMRKQEPFHSICNTEYSSLNIFRRGNQFGHWKYHIVLTQLFLQILVDDTNKIILHPQSDV